VTEDGLELSNKQMKAALRDIIDREDKKHPLSDDALREEMERVGFYHETLEIVKRVMRPKDGGRRNGILVFTRFVEDAERLAEDLMGFCEVVSGKTPKKEREAILERFKAGDTEVVANVGVLTTGFDFPALDTIILARPTMSLALYYQMVGRAIRPYEYKDGWVVDLCGSISKFGKVEDLTIEVQGQEKWIITSNGKQLTNKLFTK
jgi:DNA repair protein RadD